MIDIVYILHVLRVNGLDEVSSASSIGAILDTLQFQPEDKQKIFDTLKLKGWTLGESAINKVSHPPTFAQTNAQAPASAVQPQLQPQSQTKSEAPIPTQPQIQTQLKSAVFMPQKVSLHSEYKISTHSPSGNSHKSFLILILLVFVLLGSAVAFGYTQKIGPFGAIALYSEDDFFTKILDTASKIKSSSYTASFSLDVSARDRDAKPFTIQVSNEAELTEQYQNDSIRAQDVTSILGVLSTYGQNSYTKIKKPYPVSLSALKNDSTVGNYQQIKSITDPVTKKQYEYKVIDNGNDFKLSTTFETSGAVSSILRYNRATSTVAVGKTVSFGKGSQYYFYVPSTPPKPFLVQLGESLRQIAPDVDVSASVSASSELKDKETANWLFNFDAEGSFGDLSYKLNADALKKDSDYYFKINNIPSLIGGLSSFKGKWIKVSAATDASSKKTNSGSSLSYISSSLPEYEKTYKENREKFIKLLRKAATAADEAELIKFKEKPVNETIDGRKLVKYSIQIRKSAILNFFTRLETVLKSDSEFSGYRSLFDDQGLKEYLESNEFAEVFDYVDSNTDLVFWVDDAGFPAVVQYSMRVIPPDTAVQLKDKQINVVLKLLFKDINKPVTIKVPLDAISLEQASAQLMGNDNYGLGATAKLKANLSNIRMHAELVYDKNKSSYGLNPFPTGACKKTSGSLFGDNDVYALIESSTENNASKATCSSSGSAQKVTSYAISIPLPDSPTYSWCIDNSGNSKQIRGSIKGSICQ